MEPARLASVAHCVLRDDPHGLLHLPMANELESSTPSPRNIPDGCGCENDLRRTRALLLSIQTHGFTCTAGKMSKWAKGTGQVALAPNDNLSNSTPNGSKRPASDVLNTQRYRYGLPSPTTSSERRRAQCNKLGKRSSTDIAWG